MLFPSICHWKAESANSLCSDRKTEKQRLQIRSIRHTKSGIIISDLCRQFVSGIQMAYIKEEILWKILTLMSLYLWEQMAYILGKLPGWSQNKQTLY